MKSLFMIFIFLFAGTLFGKIKVVTTTTVIYDIVKEVGNDKVDADYLCRGDQDPHFLEIMPKYMVKLRNADLLFKIGMGLELWAQQLIDGSRNSKLKVIDLSSDIQKKEVPSGKVDASQGDVHPFGNPHYWLDPSNAKIMAQEIYSALASISPGDEAYFKSNLDSFNSKLDGKINEWNKKMEPLKGKAFVFFHASWTYFADRYGLRIAGYVEPKPGIPPTPSHNAELFNIIKSNNVRYIMMENFYSDNAPNQIASVTGVKVIKVPTGVYGMQGINSYVQMMDYIIGQITKTS
ncbi:MAG: metal ABC transporter substrate-binding protein [Bacteroidota bacterium]|nr:metal ABC transporter substrate-binding protein [Bacteroidota bacterium]